MGIVTLIVVGFATLMRREQRQALDQQLSTQAFYAAESGVSIGRKHVDGTLGFADTPTSIDNCTGFPAAMRQISDNVSVSCLLVNMTPGKLVKTLDPSSSWTSRIETNEPIRKIRISWSTPNSTEFADSTMANSNLLLPLNGTQSTPGWGNRTSVIRTMILPGTTDRNQLISNSYHAFLYPNAAQASTPVDDIAYSASDAQLKGVFGKGNCNVDRTPSGEYCTVEITGLNANVYYLNLRAIYQDANVVVRAYNSSNQELPISGAQAEIDATGKAADVLRRIRVNVSLDNLPVGPTYAVEAFESICKRFATWPGGSELTYDTTNGSPSGTWAIDERTKESCQVDGFANFPYPN